MSEHHDPGSYEKRDALFGPTLRAGLYILAAMFLTALLVVPMYRMLARSAAKRQERPATVLKADAAAAEPSFPRLVVSEPKALAAFHAQEDALLGSYGWVEKDRGIARMPIDEAMRIVAERGLPKFPAPEPTAAPAGGAR